VSDAVSPSIDIPDAQAQGPATGAGTRELTERVVAFFLGGQRYALPLERVREIQQIVAFSEVPSGDSGVVGMVNLRGQVIPAVDTRHLVGLDAREYTLETPMVIAEIHGELVAMLVDEVQDVLELPADRLQDAPALHQLSSKMIGVARLDDGLVYVLDLDRVIGSDLFGKAG
jgi:purine-binding chemotaxis protein CheW